MFKQTQHAVEGDMKELHLMGRIPSAWQIEGTAIEPVKTRVTICLDADMVRWFRKLGPRYQVRMNQIMRMYYHGVVSGEIAIGEMVEEDKRAAEIEERKFAIYREEVRARVRRVD